MKHTLLLKSAIWCEFKMIDCASNTVIKCSLYLNSLSIHILRTIENLTIFSHLLLLVQRPDKWGGIFDTWLVCNWIPLLWNRSPKRSALGDSPYHDPYHHEIRLDLNLNSSFNCHMSVNIRLTIFLPLSITLPLSAVQSMALCSPDGCPETSMHIYSNIC